MKSIIESIIGRKGTSKGTSKLLRSFKDLQYGDVVEIYSNGDVDMYVYMPLKNMKPQPQNFDGFVTWYKVTGGIIGYWPSSEFEQRFPNHKHYDDVKITQYVTHINEWKSISSGDDIKKLFSKYNIPIKK